MKKNSNFMLVIIPIIAVSIGIGAFALSNKQEPIDDRSELVFGGPPILGNPNARVTLLEWGDYQCTYCYRFHANTKDSLFTNFIGNGKVKFVFRDFTLNGPASVLAAEASYCAGDQGKYWEYHDELYSNWEGENTGWVNMHNLKKFASNVGLNIESFDKCLQSGKYQQRVLDNYKFGQRIGINATPTFLIIDNEGNTQVIKGAQPYSVFEQVLGQKLNM
ncbi:MAG: thioredoxin domain-containing protein [Nitrososphaerales archaeon]